MPGLAGIVRAIVSNRVRLIERLGARIPRIGRADFGRISVVLVNAPELIGEVLVERADDFIKSPLLRVVARPIFGNGLLTSEGELHLERRRLVAPAFAHQRLGRYAEVMTEHTRALAEQWRAGDTVDVSAAMKRLTLGIVGRTLFDVDLLGQAEALGRDITTAQKFGVRQVRLPFPLPRRKVNRAVARLDATIYGMIRERRATPDDRGDLLSMLLATRDEETGHALDDEAVRDEAMTLFLAGHETTALAMAWSWYLLAQNPHCFARLRAEGAPYALRVLKEAMRLYPPAFALARTAVRDTKIGGFVIQRDELVLMSQWLIHRSPLYFDDPLRFDPDRFLPERESKIPRFVYFPFGGGKRICIGNQFALMEGQIILSEIARKFDMELVSRRDPGLQPLLTLRPKRAIRVRIASAMASG